MPLASCRNKDESNTIESGELVVIEDTSDINLAAYGFDTMNPIATKSKSLSRVLGAIYEPLFTIDEKMNIIPVLASSYSLSEDGTQITVDLNNETKWQDGTNFTADDVVFTLSKLRSCSGLYTSIIEKIHSFTAINKHQIMVTFDQPSTDLAYYLTFPVISKGVKYSEGADFSPVGTGPYKFVSKNSTTIFLEPDSTWHGGEASKKKINVRLVKDSDAAANTFNINEVDAITSDELNLQNSTPKANSFTKEYISDKMTFLGFNLASDKLKSPGIRQAINHLINKQEIVDNDAYGQGVVSDLAINPSSWAYKSVDYSNIPEDYIEKLFAKEGYVINGGVYYKDSAPLSLGILVNADNPQKVSIANRISNYLNAAGISSYIITVSYAEYLNRITNDSFELFVGEIAVDYGLNPSVMLTRDNYFNFESSGIDEVMTRLYGVNAKNKFKDGINEFTQKFYANPPYIPIFFKTESVIYGSYVSGVDAPTSLSQFRNIEKWYFYDKDGKMTKEAEEQTKSTLLPEETEKDKTNEQ